MPRDSRDSRDPLCPCTGFPLRTLIALISILCLDLSSTSAQPGKKGSSPKINLPASVRDKTPFSMEVAAVIASRRGDVASSADQLDRLVENQLKHNKATPNPIASDEVFLRRVYLDVAGRIPTLEEATAFLDSVDSEKRAALIDELLNSPDYVSNFYNFWADALRLVDRPQANNIADPYLAYIKDSIRTNQRYNAWVYEMLTADGKVWDNPAVGYQLRDEGMPLPYIDNTVRVFLGTQIGCAECHDHPFDQWSQYQFYQLAAFTVGTRTKIRRGDPGFETTNPANDLITKAKSHFDKGRVSGAFPATCACQHVRRFGAARQDATAARLRLP